MDGAPKKMSGTSNSSQTNCCNGCENETVISIKSCGNSTAKLCFCSTASVLYILFIILTIIITSSQLSCFCSDWQHLDQNISIILKRQDFCDYSDQAMDSENSQVDRRISLDYLLTELSDDDLSSGSW